MVYITDNKHFEEAKKKLQEILAFNKANTNLKKDSGKPLSRKVGDKHYAILATEETIETSKKLKLRNDDIIITSYPKSGSTWLRQIVLQLVYDNYWDEEIPQYLASPMIEFYGSKVVDQYPSPRVLKTHFDFEECPINDMCKYIYVVRNPKDAMVSYYNHMKNISFYQFNDASFDDFFNHFFTPSMEWGNYFDNVKSWVPYLDKPNVLFLVYEDLKKDLHSNVKKIVHFIGGDVEKKYSNDEKIAEVVERSSFDFMKSNHKRFSEDDRCNTFLRKGASRDWKNYLSKDQSDKIDTLFSETFKETKLENLWVNEMKF